MDMGKKTPAGSAETTGFLVAKWTPRWGLTVGNTLYIGCVLFCSFSANILLIGVMEVHLL